MKARIGRALIVGVLAVPAVSVASGTAWAAGTSAKTNGCYVQWWNTAWSAKCNPASASGSYMAHVARADQVDYSGPWRYVKKASVTTFDSGEAWRGVQSAGNYVAYKG
ncbi:hypothetical protein ACT17Q_15885 [Cellulomonas sp. CW35]|uniref:hypothetical protein n=1 Tax=Cellulomonas sp. CW35 TaxID=3458249 RepID=UPI004033348E